MREAVGEIKCPLCQRPAELHASESRTKLDPDAVDGQGKPAYPKKHFVICPPVSGYRGCGTILCNAPGAQARLMELARLFGPDGKPAKREEPPPAPKGPPSVIHPPAAPAAPKASSNPFKFW